MKYRKGYGCDNSTLILLFVSMNNIAPSTTWSYIESYFLLNNISVFNDYVVCNVNFENVDSRMSLSKMHILVLIMYVDIFSVLL